MWRITGRLENDQAIVTVGLQPLLPKALPVDAPGAPLQIPVADYRALIDTGAQLTCITERAIKRHSLRSHGLASVVGSSGANLHQTYIFYIGFMCQAVDPRGDTTETLYQLPYPQEAINLKDNVNFDVIVGMNILKHCDMTFRRDGTFTIEFLKGALAP